MGASRGSSDHAAETSALRAEQFFDMEQRGSGDS